MSAKRKTSPVQRQVQYDPCQEKTNGEQVTAANWELLRRIPAFQETAKQWTASSEFRQQHVSSRGTYAKNDPARCSLDWMLTPAERQRLAIFQTTHRLLAELHQTTHLSAAESMIQTILLLEAALLLQTNPHLRWLGKLRHYQRAQC